MNEPSLVVTWPGVTVRPGHRHPEDVRRELSWSQREGDTFREGRGSKNWGHDPLFSDYCGARLSGYLLILSKQSALTVSARKRNSPLFWEDERYIIWRIRVLTSVSGVTETGDSWWLMAQWLQGEETAPAQVWLGTLLLKTKQGLTSSEPRLIHHN